MAIINYPENRKVTGKKCRLKRMKIGKGLDEQVNNR